MISRIFTLSTNSLTQEISLRTLKIKFCVENKMQPWFGNSERRHEFETFCSLETKFSVFKSRMFW